MSPLPLHGGGGTAYPFAPPGLDRQEERRPSRAAFTLARLIEIILGRLDPGLIGRLIVGAARQDA